MTDVARRRARRRSRPISALLGLRITPLTAAALAELPRQPARLGLCVIFLVLFVLSLFAEFIANDRPLLVRYDGALYFPVLNDYPETTFGGNFATEADYRDPYVAELIDEKGWMSGRRSPTATTP